MANIYEGRELENGENIFNLIKKMDTVVSLNKKKRVLIIFNSILMPMLLFLTDLKIWAQIPDSLLQSQLLVVESVQQNTNKQLEAQKQEYDSIEQAYTSLSIHFRHKADSLNSIGLSSEKIASKIDSLDSLKEQKLNNIKSKAEELKRKSIAKIEELDLPPEISQKVGEYTQSLNSFNIALPKAEIDFPRLDVSDVSMPGIKTSLLLGINDLNVSKTPDDIKLATDRIKDIQQNIPEVPSTETIAEKVEDKTGEIVSKKISEFPSSTGIPEVPTDGEAVKKELVNQAKKQAVDHFAGKQEQLKTAMEQMSKYKQKYSSVQSIKDIPKKSQNEMHGKPFAERLVPGISFQYLFKNSYVLDINLYTGYCVTGKIITGIGWNQRLARFKDNSDWNHKAFIYGPRAFANYKLNKGFSGHLEVETMNAFVPYNLSDPQAGQRNWVWSTMTGIKKEYRVTKNIKGSVLILYNLHDPRHRSPYNDRLNTRFGFEYSKKKKQSDKTKTGVH